MSQKSKVDKIIESLAGFSDIRTAFDFLHAESGEGMALQSTDPNTFHGGGFQVILMRRGFAEQEAGNIRKANQLAVDAAPVFYQVVQFQGEDVALILRWPGTEDKWLVRYADARDSLSSAAKERFRGDMRKLARAGLIHGYGMRGTLHWFINPGDGRLMLNGWPSLRQIKPEESAALESELERLLSGQPRQLT